MSTLDSHLIAQMLGSCKTKEDIVGKNGLIQQHIKQTLQKALDTELEEQLGYKKLAMEGRKATIATMALRKNAQGESW